MNWKERKITVYPFDETRIGELSSQEEEMYKGGFMKTIYVPHHPYVKQVKLAIATQASNIVKMYESPHLKAQDFMHQKFFDTYFKWSYEAVKIDKSQFPYQYPTSGSSEAIRESIAHYGNKERAARRIPQIHVFEGEYEGYTAYAKAHNVEIVVHSRGNYKETLKKHLKPGQKFYISAPSGIDGNIWKGYEEFLQHIEKNYEQSEIMLDLAYLNTTAETPQIRTNSSVINAIFISMSKSFPGTYYDRIGGVISKSELPGLYGNMWFKSLYSLLLGVNLMENSPLGEIPKEMRTLQLEIVEKLKKTLGEELEASDITFIATKPIPENPTAIEKDLSRNGKVRYCLTPSMDTALQSKESLF